jgi:hypothetical protein
MLECNALQMKGVNLQRLRNAISANADCCGKAFLIEDGFAKRLKKPGQKVRSHTSRGEPEFRSIATITALGIKFYSVFLDGTLLVSSGCRSPLVPSPDSRIIKNPDCQTTEQAWLAHKKRAAELGARNLSLSSFADYVEIEKMKLGMVIQA